MTSPEFSTNARRPTLTHYPRPELGPFSGKPKPIGLGRPALSLIRYIHDAYDPGYRSLELANYRLPRQNSIHKFEVKNDY